MIHDGDVTELDPNDFKQIAKLRLFLLNDSILIARQNEDIKGGSQFIFKSTVKFPPCESFAKSIKSVTNEKQN